MRQLHINTVVITQCPAVECALCTFTVHGHLRERYNYMWQPQAHVFQHVYQTARHGQQ